MALNTAIGQRYARDIEIYENEIVELQKSLENEKEEYSKKNLERRLEETKKVLEVVKTKAAMYLEK